MQNSFFRKIGLIPAWVSEFFYFCPLKRRRKLKDNNFLIIGHRGSPGKEIENTISSFNRAMKDGANALEVDLSMTKDGEVVIWHDWDPNDTTSILRESGFEPFVKYKPHPPALGSIYRTKLSNLTLNDFLENYDYKLRHSENSSTANAKIPTLREFFEWSKKQENLLYVFFDIKCPADECSLSSSVMEKLKAMVDEYKTSFKIVIETADKEVLQILRKLDYFEYCLDIEPPFGVILDPSEYSAVQTAIDYKNNYALALRPRKITVANWTTYRRIIRHDIKLREKHNIINPDDKIESLICATVSKENELRCLVKMGVGGIQTDFPDRLYKIAMKYGKKLKPDKINKEVKANY